MSTAAVSYVELLIPELYFEAEMKVFTSEKGKTPNRDSVVLVQDARMGFHIFIVGY